MSHAKLFVCVTCDRYAPEKGKRGQDMAQAITDASLALGSDIDIRRVECLNGCPNPCSVALRAPGKFALRLSRLTPEDAASVMEVVDKYVASQDGDLAAQDMPETLREKLRMRTPPLCTDAS